MCQSMVFVVTFLVKALAADIAHPRRVTEMYAHVRVQRGAAVKRFSARRALMRSCLRVDDLMTTQR